MKIAIDLRPDYLEVVKEILLRHFSQQTKIWVFGSRVTGTAKPYSDIDIVIDAESSLSLDTMAKLANDFDESVLPYKVDIVDWNTIDAAFKEKIEHDRVVLPLETNRN